MRIKILIMLLLTVCSANAEISKQEIEADCNQIKRFAINGDKEFKLKQYTKAREEYESQVAWAESCESHEIKVATRYGSATAYNNVALTYIHEGKFLKAKAWLDIAPNDKKSIFNQKKIKKEIQNSTLKLQNTFEGEYWRYAGKSLWNVITIRKENQKYRFDFSGYYAGFMAMYYGPNMGEFSAALDIKNGLAHYSMAEENDYSDCVYDFVIKDNTLKVNHTSGHSCGFGHNVYAEGIYNKVEF